jgi:hypothetical protein
MKIEVNYDGNRTFGTGKNARKYKVKISRSRWPKGLSLSFLFNPHAAAESDNWDNQASVKSGEIRLPKRQAIALATSILWYCQQSECEKDIEPLELSMDEDAIENISVLAIGVEDLADKLDVKSERITEEAQKQKLKQHRGRIRSGYIPLDTAKEITNSIKQGDQKN